ncbi:Uncharacterized protein DAT39_015418, partial [Clarias magur]
PLLRYSTKSNSRASVDQNFNLRCCNSSNDGNSTRSIRMQKETQLPRLDREAGFSAWYSDT